MEKFIAWLEKHLMPIANKIAKQRHLMAIRDTFMTILPPLFFGAIIAVINAGSGFESTNAFLVAWKNFATNNSLILGWLNLITMSVMSLYVCIGITYYLSKRYELNVFMPLITAVAGFVMLASYPQELGYGNALVQITYWDGKGILVAIFVAIFTVEMFKLMRDKKVGYIKMPDSVPAALSDTFASLVPTIIILTIDSIIFTICSKAAGTSLAGVVINILSPAFEVADSLPVAMLVAFLLNVGWFFVIHDAVWSGLLAPIEYGTLSINAAAKAAGTVLPHVFTVSFWCYFGIIGGLGNCLALGILCLTSKKEDIKISLFNGNLTISACHNETKEEKDAKGTVLRSERYSGTTSRTFYVGDSIKDSDIKASYNDGVLCITVPTAEKKEAEEKKFISIA